MLLPTNNATTFPPSSSGKSSPSYNSPHSNCNPIADTCGCPSFPITSSQIYTNSLPTNCWNTSAF